MTQAEKMRVHAIWWFVSLLAFGIVVIYAAPYMKMGYIDDDFGDVLRSMSEQISRYWTGETLVTHWTALPQYAYDHAVDFFGAFYRPIWCVFGHLQGSFGLLGAYASLWVSAIAHAAICGIIFFQLLPFTGLLSAGLLTSLYAFHPTLGFWLGRMSREQYLLDTGLIITVILLLRRFLQDKKIGYLIASVACFASVLLVRETPLFLPFWLTLASWWYAPYFSSKAKKSRWQDDGVNAVKATWPFYLVSLVYVGVRINLFPLPDTSISGTVSSIPVLITRFADHMSHMFYQHLSFVVDVLSVNTIPSGNFFLKLGLLLFIGTFVGGLFVSCSRKKDFFVWFAGFLVLSWPSLFLRHVQSYVYESLPLFLCALAWLIVPWLTQKKDGLIRNAILCMFLLGITTGALRGWQLMHEREERTHIMAKALDQLLQDKRLNGKDLCFMGVPYQYFQPTAIDAAVRLHASEENEPRFVYHDTLFCYWEPAFIRLEGLVESNSAPRVTRTNGTVNVEFIESSRAWIPNLSQQQHIALPFADVEVNHGIKDKAWDITVHFKAPIRHENLVIAAWNSRENKFYIL